MELYALVSLAVVVSFTSPCCLPLLPGYLSYVTGLTQPIPIGNEDAGLRTRNRRRALVGAGIAARRGLAPHCQGTANAVSTSRSNPARP